MKAINRIKNNLFISFSFILFGTLVNGQILETENKKLVQRLDKQSVTFLENKGQMRDMNDEAVPFVLFKVEIPGKNIFITEKGLTIQTFKMVESGNKKSVLDPINEGREKSGSDHDILQWERVDMLLVNATIRKENIVRESEVQGKANFFHASCPEGIYGVKKYEKITIKDVYPGIDWVFYNATSEGLKYDFVVHPHGDHSQIKLMYRSKTPISINKKGEIEIHTDYGSTKENAPVSYYGRNELETAFHLGKQTRIEQNDDKGYESIITFKFPKAQLANLTSDLIIDPQLWWSTFYGGGFNEYFNAIETDDNGNLLLTGKTQSVNFPVQSTGTYFQGTNGGSDDVFIAKFSNAGSLLWATYYGGNQYDEGSSIDTDNNGNIFVTGTTESQTNFPVQNVGTYSQSYGGAWADLFILKFDSNGTRLWATFYGGNGNDVANCLTVDLNGNLFVSGYTHSTNFPTQNAGTFYQSTAAGTGYDAFILKFDNSGTRLWATYYGGGTPYPPNGANGGDSGNSIITDGSGNIFVVGTTTSIDFPLQNAGTYFQGSYPGANSACFILKFDNSGNRLWATYYGGSQLGGFYYDGAYAIATDFNGNIFITGQAASNNFPVQNAGTYFQGTGGTDIGNGDIFILKFDNSGNRLWGTYFGSTAGAQGMWTDNLATDECGTIYVSYNQGSSIQPTPSVMQTSCDGGYFDGSQNGNNDFGLLRFSNNGTLLWSTLLGGDGGDVGTMVAVDQNNDLFLTGKYYPSGGSSASTYPLINPGGGAYYDATTNGNDDGFIAKFIQTPFTFSTTTTDASCSCTGTASITTAGGCQPLQSVWYDASWGFIDDTTTISQLCAGDYHVIVSDTINCKIDTADVTIIGIGTFTISSTQVSASCSSPGSATITATGGIEPYTYNWSNGQITATATDLEAGTYSVIITDSTGCTQTNTITILSTGGLSLAITSQVNASCSSPGSATVTATGGIEPYTYNWSNGQTTATTTDLNAGTYTVIVTDSAGCTQDTTITIFSTGGLSLTIASQTNVSCYGHSDGSATISSNGGTAPYSYSWSPNASTTATAENLSVGTYTVHVSDPNGCTDSLTVSIQQPDSLQVTASTVATTCGNDNGSATITSTGGTIPYSYNWQPNVSTTSNAANLSEGSCAVTITDGNGCMNDVVVNISGSSMPNAAFTFSPVSACDTACVILSAEQSGLVYNWVFSNGMSSSLQNPTPCFTESGSYNATLTVTDATGCSATFTQTNIATVYPAPTASFTINPVSATIYNPTITFINQSSGATNWIWQFDDENNSSSILEDPIFTYHSIRSYCPVLQVSNQYGCVDSAVACIEITDEFVFYAPNAFTPDNSGPNDGWLPVGVGIDEYTYEMMIYDRWGNLIWESHEWGQAWDGKIRNGNQYEIAKQDIYIWKCQFRDKVYGKYHLYNGHISLLK